MNKRFHELDSLRGLAALTVVLEHIFMMLPSMDSSGAHRKNLLEDVISYTPLRIIWAGHEAVIFFFLLSGFVLALPFVDGKAPQYGVFLVRRICRIWVPYICAVFLALLAQSLLYHPLRGLGDPQPWSFPVTLKLLLAHVFLVGNFNVLALDPVIWSLVHEMRISLIFPILMLLVVRVRWEINALVAVLLSGIGYSLNVILTHNTAVEITGAYSFTVHFAAFFILGGILAKHRNKLADKVKSLSGAKSAGFFVVALLLYGFSHELTTILNHKEYIGYNLSVVINDWIISFGAMYCLIAGLALPWFSRFLLWKPVRFLGRISYSLYLFHHIVLQACVYGLSGLPLGLRVVIAAALAIPVAYIAYIALERPSIRFGRWITSRSAKARQNALSA